ncbi:alpha hydrolase-3 [Coleophoma cylindrospora]|uniref:Alpha hydrolase-3 n=1 Tax=Coleophoma cylindrospora TaxID=1849047 RepID=A0A3D8SQK7_9HELO|nr:alpha hydrolase-3 [Coleophoma cylindrospora]
MSILYARWCLLMKAVVWRALMAIGMKLHHFADPKPPAPSFKIVIPSRLSKFPGTFKLVLYVPEGYVDDDSDYRWPVVVNFHGGGFTLGTGTDDARWAAAVIEKAEAVLVSVEYRLAPEFPFSVGVEDGTDALLYLAAHAEELRLDPQRIALSGFSAGGNFALTVPLMLYDLQNNIGKRSLTDYPSPSVYGQNKKSSSTLSLPRPDIVRIASSNSSTIKLSDLEPTELEISQKVPDLHIRAIVSFYPPTDFRSSRAEKRSTNIAPEKNLPPLLTTLFDESYLHPLEDIDFTDPYLSPAAASDQLLKDAYPQDIILYTCEYDMLNAEGVAFGERLSGSTINKTVKGGLIKEVPHAFDKKPNPLRFPKAADRCYAEACAILNSVFGGRSTVEEQTQLEKSKTVERFDDESPSMHPRDIPEDDYSHQNNSEIALDEDSAQRPSQESISKGKMKMGFGKGKGKEKASRSSIDASMLV